MELTYLLIHNANRKYRKSNITNFFASSFSDGRPFFHFHCCYSFVSYHISLFIFLNLTFFLLKTLEEAANNVVIYGDNRMLVAMSVMDSYTGFYSL